MCINLKSTDLGIMCICSWQTFVECEKFFFLDIAVKGTDMLTIYNHYMYTTEFLTLLFCE